MEKRLLFSGALVTSFGTNGIATGPSVPAGVAPYTTSPKYMPYGDGGLFSVNGTVVTRLTPAGTVDTRFAGGSLNVDDNKTGETVLAEYPESDGSLLVERGEGPGISNSFPSTFSTITFQHYTKTGNSIAASASMGRSITVQLLAKRVMICFRERVLVAPDGSFYVSDAADTGSPNGFASIVHIPVEADASGLVNKTINNTSIPSQLLLDNSGNVFVIDEGISASFGGIAEVNKDGNQNQFYGDGNSVLFGDIIDNAAIDSKGRLIIAERANDDSPEVVVRLLSSGKLDPTFGTKGTITLPAHDTPPASSPVVTIPPYEPEAQILVEPDDSVLVARLVQPVTNGILEPSILSFDSNGAEKANKFGRGIDEVFAIVQRPSVLYGGFVQRRWQRCDCRDRA